MGDVFYSQGGDARVIKALVARLNDAEVNRRGFVVHFGGVSPATLRRDVLLVLSNWISSPQYK